MRQAPPASSPFAWAQPAPSQQAYQHCGMPPTSLDHPTYDPQQSFDFTNGLHNDGAQADAIPGPAHAQLPFDVDFDLDIGLPSDPSAAYTSIDSPRFDSKASAFSPDALSDVDTWSRMSMSSINTDPSTTHHRDPSDIPSSSNTRFDENASPVDNVTHLRRTSRMPFDRSAVPVHAKPPPESLESQRRSEKSERARNAAVQRHTKTKHARKESSSMTGSESKVDGLLEGQKEKNREKNKIAAAKCRAKKRENMDLIESNHRTLSGENNYLKRREQQLRESVAQLRTLALDHQNCHCGVHQYNMHEARKMTLGMGGFDASVDAVCSPTNAAFHPSTAMCNGSGPGPGPHSCSNGTMSPSARDSNLPDAFRAQPGPFPASMECASASMPVPEALIDMLRPHPREQGAFEYDR